VSGQLGATPPLNNRKIITDNDDPMKMGDLSCVKLSERVSVIIVTFNNTTMLANLLSDLRSQQRLPDEVIVIDNSDRDETENLIKSDYPEVLYFRLGENLGSAGGYHEGICRASISSDLIYTLDDDVRLYPDALLEVIDGFHTLDQSMPGQIAGVRSVGEHHRETVPTPLVVAPWRGTLFNNAVIREVGPPFVEFFLYGDDLEYSLRIAQKGYKFYWIPSSRCVEASRNWDGKSRTTIRGKRHVYYREPFRLYYAFRNEMFIYLQYRCFLMFFRLLLYAAKLMPMILVTERWAGWKMIRAVLRGLIDGSLGKLGKNRHYVPI